MDLSWLQCLILGLISGTAEFLPVSAEAHSTLARRILNIPAPDALLRLVLHGAALAALLWFCRWQLVDLREEQRIQRSRSRSVRLHSERQRRVFLRLWKNSLIPLVICFFLLRRYDYASQLEYLCLLLLGNGLILFLPSVFPYGNKDGRNMSPLDGLLMSLGCGLGFLPGLSRVGVSLSLGSLAGVDKSAAFRLGMLLWIPCLVLLMVADGAAMLSGGLVLSAGLLLRYLAAGLAAFAGSSLSLAFMQFLSAKAGVSGFCFYSWGLALLSFILYLVV